MDCINNKPFALNYIVLIFTSFDCTLIISIIMVNKIAINEYDIFFCNLNKDEVEIIYGRRLCMIWCCMCNWLPDSFKIDRNFVQLYHILCHFEKDLLWIWMLCKWLVLKFDTRWCCSLYFLYEWMAFDCWDIWGTHLVHWWLKTFLWHLSSLFIIRSWIVDEVEPNAFWVIFSHL